MFRDRGLSAKRQAKASARLRLNALHVTRGAIAGVKPFLYLALSAGLIVGVIAGPLGSVAEASPATVTLYASPSGTAPTGCESTPTSTSSACSLKNAVAAATTYSNLAVTIDLVHSSGSACSTAKICKFKGTLTIPSHLKASLTIKGSGLGTDSSAQTVLDGEQQTVGVFLFDIDYT